RKKEWVVYAKPPFGSPAQVLKYLARYTHRVAISNARLLSMDDHEVRFAWRDRAHGNRRRVMALPGAAFLRRFLLHVLPRGFVRRCARAAALTTRAVAIVPPAPLKTNSLSRRRSNAPIRHLQAAPRRPSKSLKRAPCHRVRPWFCPTGLLADPARAPPTEVCQP